jgi:hypothetical protein
MFLAMQGMKMFLLVLALVQVHSTHAVAGPCSCQPVASLAGKDYKDIVVVVAKKRPFYCCLAKTAYKAGAYPVRAAATGVYGVVQSPRMLAEYLAFRHIGEYYDPCEPQVPELHLFTNGNPRAYNTTDSSGNRLLCQ